MRTGISIGLLTLVGLSGPVGAEEWRLCGDDYWFTVESPEGWEVADDVTAMGVTLIFTPGSGSQDGAVSVVLPTGAGSREPRAADLDQALMGWMNLVNAFGAPARIADWDMRHPTQPTRSAVAEGGSGRLYVSIVDAGSGRGHVFVATQGVVGDPSPEARAAFQSILSSLKFDATRVCGWGPDGQEVERRIAPAAPQAPMPSAAAEAFPIERAMGGCAALQELFVPVHCQPAQLDGDPVWVVSFQDGDEPAHTYRDRFRDRVTTPWCWAARGRGDAPGLLFTARGEDSLREYSCADSDWTRTVSRQHLEPAD